MSERDYLVCLAAFPGFGPASLNLLYCQSNSWQAIFTATAGALEAWGLPASAAAKFVLWRQNFAADNFISSLERSGIKTICLDEKEYPPLLTQIYQPPLVLFYLGSLAAWPEQPCLAVVGSRNPSVYGQHCVKTLLAQTVAARLSLISGLAIGIDSLAHRAALEAGGFTTAVVGSGLDEASLYPSSNRQLAAKIIAAGGAIISEFPPGTPGYPSNFPRRNRLISGLAQATLVIEAAAKSGSLITARYALEQNREVLAVPGPINSRLSAGTNSLIRQGATPITGAEDLADYFGLTQAETAPQSDLSGNELQIWKRLGEGPKTADELKALLNLDIYVITTALSLLEIKGAVLNLGGGQYGQGRL